MKTKKRNLGWVYPIAFLSATVTLAITPVTSFAVTEELQADAGITASDESDLAGGGGIGPTFFAFPPGGLLSDLASTACPAGCTLFVDCIQVLVKDSGSSSFVRRDIGVTAVNNCAVRLVLNLAPDSLLRTGDSLRMFLTTSNCNSLPTPDAITFRLVARNDSTMTKDKPAITIFGSPPLPLLTPTGLVLFACLLGIGLGLGYFQYRRRAYSGQLRGT